MIKQIKLIAKVLTIALSATAIAYAAESDFQYYLQSSFDRNVQSLTNSSFEDFINVFRKNSEDLNQLYSDGIPQTEINKLSKQFKDAGFLVVRLNGKNFSYPDYSSLINYPGLDKKWKDFLKLQIKLKPTDSRTPEQIRNLLINIDGFLKKNPNFSENIYLKTQYLALAKEFLVADDDRQLDTDSRFKQEYLKSFKKLLERNSSLLIAPAVREFDTLLSSRDNEADYDFMRSQSKALTKKLSSLLGIQAVSETSKSANSVEEEQKKNHSTETTTEIKDISLTPASEEAKQFSSPETVASVLRVDKEKVKERKEEEKQNLNQGDTAAIKNGEDETKVIALPQSVVAQEESYGKETRKIETFQKNTKSLLEKLKEDPLHEFSPIETLQMYGELMHVTKSEFKDYESWINLFNERIKEYGCFIPTNDVQNAHWNGGIVRDIEEAGRCKSLLNRISYDKTKNKSICRHPCITTRGLDHNDKIINPYISLRDTKIRKHASIAAKSLVESILEDKKGLDKLGYTRTILYFFEPSKFQLPQEELERLKQQSSNYSEGKYWVSSNPNLPIFNDSTMFSSLFTEDFKQQREIDGSEYAKAIAFEKQQKEEKDRQKAEKIKQIEEKKATEEQERKKAQEIAPTYKGDFLGVFTPGETSKQLFKEVLRLRGCELGLLGEATKVGSASSCFELPYGHVTFEFDKNQIASEAYIRMKGDNAIKTYLAQLTKKFGEPEKEEETGDLTRFINYYVWKTPKLVIEMEEIFPNIKTLPSHVAREEVVKAEARGTVTVFSRNVYEEARAKKLTEEKQKKDNFNQLF